MIRGNRSSITYPDGVTATTQYDALGRAYFLHSSIACCLAYRSFLPHGAPDGISRADGSGTGIAYDPLQRPSLIGHSFPNGAGNVTTSFWRNASGQLAGQVRDNDAYAWTGHYAVNRAYTTNGLNQYTAAGGASFLYDLNGNLTSDGSRTYVYDIENRLVSSSAGAALVYDPLGRLFQVSTPTAGVTRFLYDGDALVVEYNGGNLMARRHLHWPGADVPMMTWEGAGFDPNHLHVDERGSIIAVDNAAGLPTINRYDEYGIPGVGNVGRFQYTGQAWLDELGMYYYKARIYSPTLGRFLQTDPVGYEGGNNLYAYVGNDPVNLTDPDGQLPAALAPVAVICTGPQAAGCAAVGGGIAVVGCMLNSGCRNSPIGWGIRGVLGDFSGPAQAIAGALFNEGDAQPETNPFNPGRRGVSEPVIVVDRPGNAIPVGQGEHITSDPKDNYHRSRVEVGGQREFALIAAATAAIVIQLLGARTHIVLESPSMEIHIFLFVQIGRPMGLPVARSQSVGCAAQEHALGIKTPADITSFFRSAIM